MNTLPLPSRILLRHFTYLPSKAWSWTAENSAGGSFSNSGFHNSKSQAIRHLRAQLGVHRTHNLPITTYAIDTEGNETVVETQTLL